MSMVLDPGGCWEFVGKEQGKRGRHHEEIGFA